MSTRNRSVWSRVLSLSLLGLAGLSGVAAAKEILIADRLTNSVFRYSPSGAYLGTVLTDNGNLNQPSAVQVSPDLTKLYVSSTQNNRVVQYDYNYGAGTASNPVTFANAAEGILFPHFVLFSQDGSRVYVSNLGGTGVAQFDTAGNLAGPPVNGLVAGGSIFQYSGLAWAPSGQLLVGGFQDFPDATSGAVAQSDPTVTFLTDFIGPSTNLNGAASLLVDGNDLYVASGYSGRVDRFNATTGAVDNSFAITGLAFPESIILAPDGNGILVGVLGVANGLGNISRYGFDGSFLGTFALPQPTPATGFREATGMTMVPEPSSFVLAGFALAALCWYARRQVVR